MGEPQHAAPPSYWKPDRESGRLVALSGNQGQQRVAPGDAGWANRRFKLDKHCFDPDAMFCPVPARARRCLHRPGGIDRRAHAEQPVVIMPNPSYQIL